MIAKDKGFIVKKTNFRETSIIATIYTYKFGKIQGILKGFYAAKKEFSSPLDIFSLNEFVFYPKKSEIWLVGKIDLINDFPYLKQNADKFSSCGLIFNIINRISMLHDRNEKIFILLKQCLEALEKEPGKKIIYVFLLKFLSYSGFKPELRHCIRCGKNVSERMYFDTKAGGLVCDKCAMNLSKLYKISAQTALTILYIQNNDFPQVLRIKPSLKTTNEIIFLLRKFLEIHLGFKAFSFSESAKQ